MAIEITVNWEALGALGEIIGAVAVVATLVYLAAQIKQNTRALHATAAQAFSDSINDVNQAVASDPQLARITRLCFEQPETLTEDERAQMDYLILATCRSHDSALAQEAPGTIDAQTARMLQNILKDLFATQYYQDWWQRTPYRFTDRFTKFIENDCGLKREYEYKFSKPTGT